MLTLTPVALQILHLLGADLVWLSLLAYAAAELSEQPQAQFSTRPVLA
jgi:hypothetical protein